MPYAKVITIALLSAISTLYAQNTQAYAAPAGDSAVVLDRIQISGNWLGSGLENSVKSFVGARTVVDREQIENTGANNVGDVMRRIPGVQATDNSGTAGQCYLV